MPHYVHVSVRPYVSARLLLEGFLSTAMFVTFMKIYTENPNLVKIGPKRRTNFTKTSVRLIVAGDIISPHKYFCATLDIVVFTVECISTIHTESTVAF